MIGPLGDQFKTIHVFKTSKARLTFQVNTYDSSSLLR